MKDKNGIERSIVCMLVRRDRLEWKATFAAFVDGEMERYTPKVSLAFFVLRFGVLEKHGQKGWEDRVTAS
jgi:hypothetical protein